MTSPDQSLEVKLKLNQEEIDDFTRPIIRSEIELGILKKKKTLPANKSPKQNGFNGECYQTYKEELIPNFLKLFQKT